MSKLVAVTLAMLAGFLLGKSSKDGEPSSPHNLTGARVGTAAPSENATIGTRAAAAAARTSPKGSPLSETLKFERYLATCDLGRFPVMLEEEFSSSDERWPRIMQIWLERDRDGCVAWIASQPAMGRPDAQGHQLVVRHNLTEQIARQDPDAAWLIADQINAAPYAKYSILVNALKRDPAKALELARSHPGVMIGGGAFMLNERAGFDPMRALPVIEALHPGGSRNSLANDGLNHYAAHPDKLTEAGEWFEQLPADAKRFVVRRLERKLSGDSNTDETVQKLHEIWDPN
jgi:hypothetical protein